MPSIPRLPEAGSVWARACRLLVVVVTIQLSLHVTARTETD
jgi:hypothetical protein